MVGTQVAQHRWEAGGETEERRHDEDGKDDDEEVETSGKSNDGGIGMTMRKWRCEEMNQVIPSWGLRGHMSTVHSTSGLLRTYVQLFIAWQFSLTLHGFWISEKKMNSYYQFTQTDMLMLVLNSIGSQRSDCCSATWPLWLTRDSRRVESNREEDLIIGIFNFNCAYRRTNDQQWL